MATVTQEVAPPVGPETSAGNELFRISLDTYKQMGEAGLIRTADRVVLLDGLLVRKMTKGPRHSFGTLAVQDLLKDHLHGRFHLRPELPIDLPLGPDGSSAPEPDVTVARGLKGDYATRNPGPGDVLLVVEVADSSPRLDRQGLRRYAHAGIPTVWIVNLRAGVVEVYTDPSGPTADPGYATKATRGAGTTLDLALDDRRVEGLPVAGLFG